MKRLQTQSTDSVGRLAEWCKRPSPPYALAVGSTCGCEMARLERDICEHLNHRMRRRDGLFGVFDCEDVRCFAGHPEIRDFIAQSSRLVEEGHGGWNDYEQVLRGLAAIGGVVIGGQAALDATRDFDHVFKVALSKGGRFDVDELTTCLNPDRCGPSDCLVAMIADSFLDWAGAQGGGLGKVRKGLEVPEFRKMNFEGAALDSVVASPFRRRGDPPVTGMLSRSWR